MKATNTYSDKQKLTLFELTLSAWERHCTYMDRQAQAYRIRDLKEVQRLEKLKDIELNRYFSFHQVIQILELADEFSKFESEQKQRKEEQ